MARAKLSLIPSIWAASRSDIVTDGSVMLPETVWLVLAIVLLDQPITRAEMTARRMADSDRQVQVLLQQRLIREEPRAAVPGRGVPLVTTELVPRRFGMRSIGELEDYLLSRAAESQTVVSDDFNA
jgi:chromosome segregation and condensation protein ScpB